jgi:lysophospholipase L1-like esterase
VWRALGGVLVGVGLVALTGEALVRATGALDAGPVPRRLLERGREDGLPYRLRHGERLRVLGREVRVNALGLRGPETGERPPPGSRRILVLGDSVVFGWGLEETESYPVRLAEALRRGNVAAEVLNAGVPGFSIADEAALHREIAPALAPDAVVLAVSLNDFTPAPTLSPLGVLISFDAEPAPGWLAHSELFAFLRGRLADLRAARDRDGADRSDRVERFLRAAAIASRERFYAGADAAGWQPIERGLRELRDRARDAGSPLLVVIFPEEDQLEAAGDPWLPQERWAARCQAERLRCLDLAPAFLRAAGGEPLFADLQHPSARGSEVAAQATADALAPLLDSRR